MEDKKFMKGCEAVAEAAVRAGCRYFAGYPITPQNAVPEYLSRRLPQVGGVFMQGESEIASSNMVYGGATAGIRSLLSSSSCGISLMSETISWMAQGRLPAVICNFQRGGPGIGSIQPSQQDYNQATRALGNGGYRMIVQAPADIQEAVEMTYDAFDIADKYSYPTVVLLDGFTGSLMEPVTLPPMKSDEEIQAIMDSKTWVPKGRGPEHVVHKGAAPAPVEVKNPQDAAMYEKWKETEVRYEVDGLEDAKLVVTSYGVSARIAESAVEILREEGYKLGFIRAKRIYPFPDEAFEQIDYDQVKGIMDVEMSKPAQYAEDVKVAVRKRAPIETCLTSGGVIIDRDDVVEAIRDMYNRKVGE